MQTSLSPEFRATHAGGIAEAILRKCVHCGFCTATCPSYQLLGDELDSPRGRIYQIKSLLEGAPATRSMQVHLDRCLTCRNCETTCPSGVEYGRLVDIGRSLIESKVRRPVTERLLRLFLREGLTSPLFPPLFRLVQYLRPILPATLKNKLPMRPAPAWRSSLTNGSSKKSATLPNVAAALPLPTSSAPSQLLLLEGCVQPGLLPNINNATRRILTAAGMHMVSAPKAGCCGALRTHLADTAGGLADMRRNIDAWWPYVQSGAVQGIISNASGCGVLLKEYGHHLAEDAMYAAKAAKIAAMSLDLCELLPHIAPRLQGRLHAHVLEPAYAYHPPCTLQHGQALSGVVEKYLGALGFNLRLATAESHLCCGSAGTYSILQAPLAQALRERKLKNLQETATAMPIAAILSANIGCIQHLQSGTALPVMHWVELLAAALTTGEDTTP